MRRGGGKGREWVITEYVHVVKKKSNVYILGKG